MPADIREKLPGTVQEENYTDSHHTRLLHRELSAHQPVVQFIPNGLPITWWKAVADHCTHISEASLWGTRIFVMVVWKGGTSLVFDQNQLGPCKIKTQHFLPHTNSLPTHIFPSFPVSCWTLPSSPTILEPSSV